MDKPAATAQNSPVPEEASQSTSTKPADSAVNSPAKETTTPKKVTGAAIKGMITSKKGSDSSSKGHNLSKKVTLPTYKGINIPSKGVKGTGTTCKGAKALYNTVPNVKGGFFTRKVTCPFNSTDWEKAGHIPGASARAKRDIACLYTQPVPGVFFVPDEDNLMCVRAMIVGNFDTPYEGGFFQFYIRFGPQYPFEPPRVCAMSCYRFGQKVRFNPNMYEDGTVCLSILGTWSGPAWTAANNLTGVLLSIQSLFCDQALCNEPGFSVYRDTGDKNVEFYDVYVRHETLRVAVIHTIEFAEEYSIPADLVKVMKSSFMEYYTSYIASCDTYRKYDKKKLEICLIGQRGFTPNFTKLEEDLIRLHAKLTEEFSTNGNFSSHSKFTKDNASAACPSSESSLSEFSDADSQAASSQTASNSNKTPAHCPAEAPAAAAAAASSSSVTNKKHTGSNASGSSSSEDSVGETSKSEPRQKSKLKSLKSSGLASMMHSIVSNIKKVGSGSPLKKANKVNTKVATAVRIDSAYCEKILKEVSAQDGNDSSPSDIEQCLDFMSFMADSESEYEDLSDNDQFSNSEEDDDDEKPKAAEEEDKATDHSTDVSSSSPTSGKTAAGCSGESSSKEVRISSSPDLATKMSETVMEVEDRTNSPVEASTASKNTEVCSDGSLSSDSLGRGCKRESSGVIKSGHSEDERGNPSSSQ